MIKLKILVQFLELEGKLSPLAPPGYAPVCTVTYIFIEGRIRR